MSEPVILGKILPADNSVFPVRFVPDRGNIAPILLGFDQCLQLRGSLMPELISNTNGIF